MPDTLHLVDQSPDFLANLKARWHVVAASCLVALGLALIVSVMLPKRYTATAELLIQAPGGNDARAATAISPVYLESLKAYEQLALSDSLFQRAIEHVQVSGSGHGKAVEALKRSILRVTKPANTAVLEISVTLEDPRKAQALAQFLAEQTVELSRSIDAQGESDVTREFSKQLEAARARLERSRAGHDALQRQASVDDTEAQLNNSADLLFSIDREISQLRADIAGLQAEALLPAVPNPDNENPTRLLPASEARLQSLSDQRRDLIETMSSQRRRLQDYGIRLAQAEAEDKAASAAFETASTRMNETVTSGQFRGERLRLIDPGIVPQEPRLPNIPLNLLAALVLALAGSLLFVGFTSSARAPVRVPWGKPSEEALSFRH